MPPLLARVPTLRLLPVVMGAVGALLALKVGAFALQGFGLAPESVVAQERSTQERLAEGPSRPVETRSAADGFGRGLFNARTDAAQVDDDLPTGGAPKKKAPAPAEAPPPAKAMSLDEVMAKRAQQGREHIEAVRNEPESSLQRVPVIPQIGRPASESQLLERLQDRRDAIERRTQDLDAREGLLRAAEKRLESKLQELKAIEERVAAVEGKRTESEQDRMKGLVVMYESMKAKDAARIFDRLDQKILVDVVTRMKPAKVSDILAAMAPETAERLTVSLATRGESQRPAPGQGQAEARRSQVEGLPADLSDLPKIEGRPPQR